MKLFKFKLNRTSIVVLVFVLIPVVLASVLYLLEWEEIYRGRQFSDAAKMNRHLALESYLEKRDIAFSKASDFDQQMKNAATSMTTIYLPVRHGILAPHQAETLLSWVQQGGTLIYRPSRVFDEKGIRENDPVLEHIDARFSRHSNRETRNLARNTRTYKDGCTSDESALQNVTIHGETSVVDLSPLYSFTRLTVDEAQTRAPIMSTTLGNGWVHLIADDRQWYNPLFLCHDNAKLLYQLITFDQSLPMNSAFVWLEPDEFIWLTDRLWENYPIQIMLLLAVFVLWVRMVTVRQSKPFQFQQGGPRSIGEYVSSISRFQWQSGRGPELLAEERFLVMNKLKSKTQIDAIAEVIEKCGMTRDEVELALATDPGMSKRRFIDILKKLKQIRQKL